MLIDSNAVLLDGVNVAGTVVTGVAVGLTSFLKPGREEPVPVAVKVAEGFAGGTSVTLKLQEAAAENGSFTDVADSAVTVAAAKLVPGARIGWRFLPRGVEKPWIRLVATPSGTFTAGSLFGAVVREDELPQEAGMYIDAGVVKG